MYIFVFEEYGWMCVCACKVHVYFCYVHCWVVEFFIWSVTSASSYVQLSVFFYYLLFSSEGWNTDILLFSYIQSPEHERNQLRKIKTQVEVWKSSFNKNNSQHHPLKVKKWSHYLMEGRRNRPAYDRCKEDITVKHILVVCPRFSVVRRKYYSNP